MTVDRATLPNAPNHAERMRMANAFLETVEYDGGDACRAILANIRAGHILFELPYTARLTKEGFDAVQREEMAGTP